MAVGLKYKLNLKQSSRQRRAPPIKVISVFPLKWVTEALASKMSHFINP